MGPECSCLPHAPQQVTKVHEPPREDTVPPKPAPPVPPPTQHLQPEGDVSQQSGGSPRGKCRSPVPPAEKEGECWAQGCSESEGQPSSLELPVAGQARLGGHVVKAADDRAQP